MQSALLRMDARMRFFRFAEDRIPVLLFATYFAADLWVLFTATTWWFPILWWAFGIIPKGWICSWNHHHQHLTFFRVAWANRLLEIMFGFQTGVTSHAWFLHHVVGHHRNYLDQTLDESRWARPDGSIMGPQTIDPNFWSPISISDELACQTSLAASANTSSRSNGSSRTEGADVVGKVAHHTTSHFLAAWLSFESPTEDLTGTR